MKPNGELLGDPKRKLVSVSLSASFVPFHPSTESREVRVYSSGFKLSIDNSDVRLYLFQFHPLGNVHPPTTNCRDLNYL